MITVTFLVVWFLHCDTDTVQLISTSAASSPVFFPLTFAASYHKEEWEEGNGVGAIHLPAPSQLDIISFCGLMNSSTSIIIVTLSVGFLLHGDILCSALVSLNSSLPPPPLAPPMSFFSCQYEGHWRRKGSGGNTSSR